MYVFILNDTMGCLLLLLLPLQLTTTTTTTTAAAATKRERDVHLMLKMHYAYNMFITSTAIRTISVRNAKYSTNDFSQKCQYSKKGFNKKHRCSKKDRLTK